MDRKNQPEPELLRRFADEYTTAAQAEPATLVIELTFLTAWAILGNLQLACKHPENHGPNRQLAEEFARALQTQIAPSGALAEVAEKGWEP